MSTTLGDSHSKVDALTTRAQRAEAAFDEEKRLRTEAATALALLTEQVWERQICRGVPLGAASVCTHNHARAYTSRSSHFHTPQFLDGKLCEGQLLRTVKRPVTGGFCLILSSAPSWRYLAPMYLSMSRCPL